ncbi:hypothetical protein Patl1_30946 [Pistacia atlantica]|uniref:Uncharacterized protein n=1 Tax=Pistacia atlantica TaxID=434234 RepID=A0ACC1ADT5_9ROSI|nr:hypothetical protein Patl1_30946 [Pistacia atlantica]
MLIHASAPVLCNRISRNLASVSVPLKKGIHCLTYPKNYPASVRRQRIALSLESNDPKSRKAESCTIKCVTTCIRGGEGSPGEGPFNVRR